LRRQLLSGTVVMGPADISDAGSIAPEQWAIIAPPNYLHFACEKTPVIPSSSSGKAVFIFPKHTLVVPDWQVWWVLSALEAAKPERLDPDGCPLPWVPVIHRPLPFAHSDRDDDTRLDDGEVLPPCPQPEGDDDDAVIATSTIREWFSQLCATLRLGEVPLVVKRGRTNARGLVAGTVEMTSQFAPRRIAITTCPNSDQAEIVATLIHELAHSLAGSQDHGLPFCRTLVDVAARLWGEQYFAAARARLSGPYALVDRWVTCGARAALVDREPPTQKVCDDGHAARIVSKVSKLWALAADQLGKPEGIGATALANDMITMFGLDPSQICTAPIDDQLIDRWVLLERRQPWQRTLAHSVAHFNGVYSLSMDAKARMHFFGHYSDVVATVYLCEISIERIKRECRAYLEEQRRRGLLFGGKARQASVAFCESATYEFGRKLQRITAEECDSSHGRNEHVVALEEAKDFAERQLEMRGARVSAGRGREIRHNAQGAEAGRRMQVVRGIDTRGGPPRKLPGCA